MLELRTEGKTSRSDNEVSGTSGASFCVVNPHCLENIVRLSEASEVKASIDIVDERGVKLWPCGAPLSRALHERMQRRRLRQPLEASLEIENGVSMDRVIDDGLALIEQNPALEALAGQKGVPDMLRGLRSMALPGPLRLLLTLVRELRPHDYAASLAAMIVSTGLAHHAGFSKCDAGHLILAALVADIGEMYINPEYLDGARKLSPDEWKHVVWHPCLGEGFLKEFARFPAAVSDGVLHHHERFGGHGYPFQVTGEHLGMLHTLLGAADTVAAIIMRGGAGIADRVSATLHILPGEFPAPAVNFVTKMLAGLDEASSYCQGGGIAESIQPELERLCVAKCEAMNLVRGRHSLSVTNAADLALGLLLRIDQSLGAMAVYDFLRREAPEDKPAIMSKIRMIPDEISWRLRNLARNVYLEAGQSGNSLDLAALAGLVALLDPIPAAENQEPIS